MDVRCPQCETLYEIQERQLRGGGATLKCSQCDHVFRLQASVALNQENRRRWMLRNASNGDILYFSEFDQLHKWIMNGEASQKDEISRTGDRWTRLEDIGEFMPVFKAVDSISSLNNAPAVQRAGGSANASGSSPSRPGDEPPAPETSQGQGGGRDSAPHRRPQTGQRSRVRTSQQFPLESAAPTPEAKRREGSGETSRSDSARQGAERRPDSEPGRSSSRSDSRPRQQVEGPSSGSGMRTPASDRATKRDEESGASFDSGSLPATRDADDEWSFGDGSDLTEDPRQATGSFDAGEYETSRRWPVVVFIVVLLLGGGIGAVYFAKPELLTGLVSSAGEETVTIDEETPEPSSEQASASEGKSAQDVVATAVESADKVVGEREAELFDAAVEPASKAVAASVADAKKEADDEAQEPDPDAMLRSAKRLLERGSADRARKKYHQVLELQRSNVEAITGLGWSLLAAGSPAAAAAQFRRATSINPSYGDAYIGLGKAERELGNKQAALDAYSSYLSRIPGGSKASIARYQKQKLEEALGE